MRREFIEKALVTALYFHALRPEDRVAVKPHASPVFHAIQYLMGNQTREKLEAFRAYGGAQSYQGGAAWRARLMDDIGKEDGVAALLERRSDAELAELMNNLGGHCLETLTQTFDSINRSILNLFAPKRPLRVSLVEREDLTSLQPVGREIHEKPLFYWSFRDRPQAPRRSLE